MKIIEVDEELYRYIAKQTQSIGESASDILRRLLHLPANPSATLDFVSFDGSITEDAVKSDAVLESEVKLTNVPSQKLLRLKQLKNNRMKPLTKLATKCSYY